MGCASSSVNSNPDVPTGNFPSNPSSNLANTIYMCAQNNEEAQLRASVDQARQLPHEEFLNRLHDETLCTPLYSACERGHAGCVSVIIACKIDCNVTIKDGSELAPLHIAAQNGHTSVVSLLTTATGINLNQQRKDGFTALALACQKGFTPMVKVLLDANASPSVSQLEYAAPLHIAVTFKRTEIVELLLLAKANANQEMKDGATPLFLAAKEGYTDALTLLLDHSADPGLRSAPGGDLSPLHMAARNGHRDAVKLLLQAGVAVDTVMKPNITALMFAAMKSHLACVQLLVESKADVNFSGTDGCTPAQLAASADASDEVLGYMISMGAVFPEPAPECT